MRRYKPTMHPYLNRPETVSETYERLEKECREEGIVPWAPKGTPIKK